MHGYGARVHASTERHGIQTRWSAARPTARRDAGACSPPTRTKTHEGCQRTMASAAAASEDGSGISEYEQYRLEHIRRNQEMLERLGLADGSFMAVLNPQQPVQKKPRTPRPKPPPVDESQCRRSSRVKGAAPDYTGTVIDTFFNVDRREVSEIIVRSARSRSETLWPAILPVVWRRDLRQRETGRDCF